MFNDSIYLFFVVVVIVDDDDEEDSKFVNRSDALEIETKKKHAKTKIM